VAGVVGAVAVGVAAAPAVGVVAAVVGVGAAVAAISDEFVLNGRIARPIGEAWNRLTGKG
jgi:flagellar motor component MotA